MKKIFTFEKLPESISELKEWPGFTIKDPYCVAAMTVAALSACRTDSESCAEMIEFLKGPGDLDSYQKNLIKEYLPHKTHLVDSYFLGAVPENGYTPSLPRTVEISDAPDSDLNMDSGVKAFFVKSGGAEHERLILLRLRPSTGEWFLWEYAGLIMGIRPASGKKSAG